MDKRRQHDEETTINLCTATEYTLEYIKIWDVVAVSVVWNKETISSIKVYSFLSNKQQINWETYQTNNGCRHKIKSNLS